MTLRVDLFHAKEAWLKKDMVELEVQIELNDPTNI